VTRRPPTGRGDGSARSGETPPRGAPGGVTFDEVLRPGQGRDLRRLPGLIKEAVRLTWAAAPRELVLTVALQLLVALALVGQLALLRRVISVVGATAGAPEITALLPELVALGALVALVASMGLVQRERQRILAELVQKYTTGSVLGVSTVVELIRYDEPGFYDRLQRARINASVRPLQIANGMVGVVGAGAAAVAVGAALLWTAPAVAVPLIVAVPPMLMVNRRMSKLIHAHAVRTTQNDRRRAYLYDTLSRRENAHEVRAFDSAMHLQTEHDRLYDEKIADLEGTVRRRVWLGSVSAAAVALVMVGSLALLLYLLGSGQLEVADAAVAVGAVVLLASRMKALVSSGGTLYEGALFLSDFTDFVAEDVQTGAQVARSAAAAAPLRELELREVSFTYPSRQEPSLLEVSMTLRRGEVVALVGENGSGKTTLTKLLAGLYLPTTGALLRNGEAVTADELAVLRADTAIIFQDFVRYFLTAAENVAISRIGDVGDHAAVRRAATMAGADGFLSSLPSGYDTLLGPAFVGGSDLSGGQWQRVALARAYFRDAPVLVLDEPTAALDPRGEYEIFQQVRRLAEGRTVVLVSHRFSSVRAADRIIVLEQGRIVEEGSHEQLLAQQGLYEELFHLQAEGYRAGTA
jgi:ATP-binding cassette, subfamily B, bacterial